MVAKTVAVCGLATVSDPVSVDARAIQQGRVGQQRLPGVALPRDRRDLVIGQPGFVRQSRHSRSSSRELEGEPKAPKVDLAPAEIQLWC